MNTRGYPSGEGLLKLVVADHLADIERRLAKADPSTRQRGGSTVAGMANSGKPAKPRSGSVPPSPSRKKPTTRAEQVAEAQRYERSTVRRKGGRR